MKIIYDFLRLSSRDHGQIYLVWVALWKNPKLIVSDGIQIQAISTLLFYDSSQEGVANFFNSTARLKENPKTTVT
jgi:hypothetical protein